MPWARMEDGYLGNRKLAGLSTAAICLDLAGIIYSARELRDGLLSNGDVQAIASLIHMRRWPPYADELLHAGRWEATADGYVIHDYLDYQPSRQQVLEERSAAAQRMRRVRANSGRTSPEVQEKFVGSSAEVRKKFGDPVPGPGPGPERSTNVPGENPPNPPFAKGGRARSRRATTGVDFDLDGPQYEQRTGADGKREWVEIEA